MFRVVASLLAVVTFGGCAKKSAPHSDAQTSHAHTAPHGGVLVELGEHAYNLELVRDTAAGKLTVYLLDGHAENFVRSDKRSIPLNVKAGDRQHSLLLRAVANAATGETVGDTSQFEAEADWLKQPGAVEVVVSIVTIRGTNFEHVTAHLP